MKFFLIIFLSISYFSAYSECYTPDLLAPVLGLKAKLDEANDFDLKAIIGAVLELLTNCLNPTVPPATTPATLQTILNPYAELAAFNFADLKDNITAYMKTPEFEAIHNHLWNDAAWLDIIDTFYKYGWKDDHNIYTRFQQVYTYYECTLELPDGPVLPTPPLPTQKSQRRTRREVLPLPPFTMLQQEGECNILNIISDLVAADLPAASNVFKFVLEQINGNPSIHLLWAKFSEPRKGESFRETRNLPEVKRLIDHWDSVLKNQKLFELLVQILETILQADLDGVEINIVGNVISFLEYLIWRTPFPIPAA